MLTRDFTGPAEEEAEDAEAAQGAAMQPLQGNCM